MSHGSKNDEGLEEHSATVIAVSQHARHKMVASH